MFVEENVCEGVSELETSVDGEGLVEQLLASEQLLTAKEKQLQNAPASVFLSPPTEDGMSLPQKEGLKRMVENKLKYKKLKQKLTALCEQIQDQGLLKDQKDVASPNKSRLVKLALELEKSLRTQAIDYALVESLLKEIQKIVEYKREHDILILRGARMLSTLFTIIRRFPSLHRNEALQSAPALEMSLKLLRVMLALASNRECLVVTNQMIALSSLLSCALMREERKTAVNCLHLLNLLLAGPNRIELHPLINANVEYILCSSLLKRLKSYLEVCLQEDDPAHSEFLHLAFKFYHLIVCIGCKQELERPIYSCKASLDGLSKAISGYFESGIQLLQQSIIELINEKDSEAEEKYTYREEHIPNFKINILLSIFKTLNIIFHVDVFLAQKVIESHALFMETLRFIFEYTKENFQESVQMRRLCSEIIIFIGNFAFENYHYQQTVRTTGLLESLCNHPLEYLMEPALRNIIIPTYCCLIHDNPTNFKLTFAENSVQPILQFIEKEISYCNERNSEISLGGKNVHSRTLSRKTSVSSINSSYSKASMAESFSTQTSNTIGLTDNQIRLEHRFRPQFWEQLMLELKKVDD